uniref:Glutathione S-transferase omega n=2 Tax=Parascaris univalens TaxID=6257 RepID=A0A915AN98_PARUN
MIATRILWFYIGMQFVTLPTNADKTMTSKLFVGLETKALKKGDARPRPLQSGQFRIYGMRFCPYTERILIYLAKKGIKAQVVNINLKEKPEWLVEIHPDKKVPALEHDGKVVVESAIIPQYLDELLPATSILPKDPYERAVQRMLFEQAFTFMGSVMAFLRSKPEQRDEQHENLEKDLLHVESLLKDRFFGGDRANFADYLIFPFYERLVVFTDHPKAVEYNLTNLVGTERFPHLTQWYKRMSLLPEVVSARPKEVELLRFLGGFIVGEPNYDIGAKEDKR